MEKALGAYVASVFICLKQTPPNFPPLPVIALNIHSTSWPSFSQNTGKEWWLQAGRSRGSLELHCLYYKIKVCTQVVLNSRVFHSDADFENTLYRMLFSRLKMQLQCDRSLQHMQSHSFLALSNSYADATVLDNGLIITVIHLQLLANYFCNKCTVLHCGWSNTG